MNFAFAMAKKEIFLMNYNFKTHYQFLRKADYSEYSSLKRIFGIIGIIGGFFYKDKIFEKSEIFRTFEIIPEYSEYFPIFPFFSEYSK